MKKLFLSVALITSTSALANDVGLQSWIDSIIDSSDVSEAQESQKQLVQNRVIEEPIVEIEPQEAEETAEVGGCVDQNGNDIFNDSEAFQKLIAESESCAEATQLAEACNYGSSVDVSTTNIAYGICEKEMADKGAKTPAAEAALNSMNTACYKKYENENGTMYRSAESYCTLSAINWVVDHLSAEY